VFGRQTDGNWACLFARKVYLLWSFEQNLLFLHRPTQLKRTFPGLNRVRPSRRTSGMLGVRLSVGPRLQLTASGYEIEFDLLASTLDAGLKACFSEPS